MQRAARARIAALVTGAIAVVAIVAAPAPAGASATAGFSATTGVYAASTAGRLQQWGAAEEQDFVARINALRTSLGLAPLAVDGELTDQARRWADTMKSAGNIFHTTALDQGITSNWQKLGENVGVGGTVPALFDAFVASPKHYENLVDPSYRFVGVGVVWDGGRMFTTHRFMAIMPDAPPTTAPAAPARPKTTAPPAAETAPEELAAAEPPPPPPPVVPAPVVPPASPARVALILSTVEGLLP